MSFVCKSFKGYLLPFQDLVTGATPAPNGGDLHSLQPCLFDPNDATWANVGELVPIWTSAWVRHLLPLPSPPTP